MISAGCATLPRWFSPHPPRASVVRPSSSVLFPRSSVCSALASPPSLSSSRSLFMLLRTPIHRGVLVCEIQRASWCHLVWEKGGKMCDQAPHSSCFDCVPKLHREQQCLRSTELASECCLLCAVCASARARSDGSLSSSSRL
eukprot:3216666-Rhodomonas_salina.1